MMRRAIVPLFTAAGLVACSPIEDRRHGDPELRQTTAEELDAAREEEELAESRYQASLATAQIYRSEIRDLLIQHPERYRASGGDGLSRLWHGAGRSQSFRCIHPPKSIDRAQRDGWQLVQCDRRSAYFLRGPVSPVKSYDNKSLAPTLEEAFDVLMISYGSAYPLDWKRSLPRRPRSILAALPDIYERPKRTDLAQAGIASVNGNEIRVTYYDFKRRKEISVYDEADQTVVTVIFNVGERPAFGGAKGTKVLKNSVIWIQSPHADFAEMTELLLLGQEYIGGKL